MNGKRGQPKGCEKVMNTKRLVGLGVALVTPMKADGSVDGDAAKRIVKFIIDGGADFLVALGTTGEAPTLTAEEQHSFVHLVVNAAAGRVPVVVGVSGNDTRALVARLEAMDCTGVDYILSAVPSYNKPSQQGIIEHFSRVAAVAQRPVILYNVPGRTGRNMTAQTTLWLAENVENIAGVKEASGDLAQVEAILRGRPEGFAVLSGDDALTLPMMASGAEGVISVIGNALPKAFGDLVHAAQRGDFAEARAQHLQLQEMYRLLFAENNPAGIKAALAASGLCGNYLRLPLVPVTSALYGCIEREMQRLFPGKA